MTDGCTLVRVDAEFCAVVVVVGGGCTLVSAEVELCALALVVGEDDVELCALLVVVDEGKVGKVRCNIVLNHVDVDDRGQSLLTPDTAALKLVACLTGTAHEGVLSIAVVGEASSKLELGEVRHPVLIKAIEDSAQETTKRHIVGLLFDYLGARQKLPCQLKQLCKL
eukprot:1286869-Amphidinium_carterae.2